MPSEDDNGLVRCVYVLVWCLALLFKVTIARIWSKQRKAPADSNLHPSTLVVAAGVYSGPARKRPRPLEEAVEAGDGVALKFSESFAVDNQNLVLLQVRIVLLASVLI